jgi:hypothetical protein
MDVETSLGGRDRMDIDQGFAPEKKRTFHQRHFGRARSREVDPFPVKRLPWMAQDVTYELMTSP